MEIPMSFQLSANPSAYIRNSFNHTWPVIPIDNFKFKIWNQHKKLSEIEFLLAYPSQFLQNWIFPRPQTAKMHFWGVRPSHAMRS